MRRDPLTTEPTGTPPVGIAPIPGGGEGVPVRCSDDWVYTLPVPSVRNLAGPGSEPLCSLGGEYRPDFGAELHTLIVSAPQEPGDYFGVIWCFRIAGLLLSEAYSLDPAAASRLLHTGFIDVGDYAGFGAALEAIRVGVIQPLLADTEACRDGVPTETA